MEPVTFINCFEVPSGREDEFFALWGEVNQYMRAQPGYISHRFHRAIQSEARFAFVNVVLWETPEAWAKAHDAGFQALVNKPVWADFKASGALFEVVSENHA
jgi:heme-degrading monooxygenase HmoA